MSSPPHLGTRSPRAGPIQVLHADDKAGFTDLAATFMQRADDRLEIDTVQSAPEGLDRLSTKQYDCIISDYEMPRMDGLEFLQAVREQYEDLPFILFTGKGSEAIASQAFTSGATDYLQKETGSEQYTVLANRVVNYVEKYRTARLTRRRARAMQTAEEGIAIVNDAGRYVELNDAYADQYGRPATDLIGEEWTKTITDSEVQRLEAEALPAIEEGATWSGEVTGRRATGDTYEKWLSVAPLDDGGHVCVVRDITEQKQRERELKRERDRRAALFEIAPHPIVEVQYEDGAPVIMEINSAFGDTFGVDQEQIAGETVDGALVPGASCEDHTEIARQVHEGETIDRTVQHETTSGAQGFRLRVTPFEPPDGTVGAICWYRPIATERVVRSSSSTASAHSD